MNNSMKCAKLPTENLAFMPMTLLRWSEFWLRREILWSSKYSHNNNKGKQKITAIIFISGFLLLNPAHCCLFVTTFISGQTIWLYLTEIYKCHNSGKFVLHFYLLYYSNEQNCTKLILQSRTAMKRKLVQALSSFIKRAVPWSIIWKKIFGVTYFPSA